MDDGINYSAVVYKNVEKPPKERKEDPAKKVKPKQRAATKNTVPAGGKVAANSHFRLLLVFLVVVCFLLLATIISIIIIYINAENKQETNVSALTAEKEQLMEQLMEQLRTSENKTEEVSRVRDDLNQMFEIILSFSSFPANDFCPNKKCYPCQKNWIQFQEKCYFFSSSNTPWKTWEDSQKRCQKKASDLLIVDNLQEQEFIANNIDFYYDKNHGFWFGLNKISNNWVWIDGRNETLRYWIRGAFGHTGPCALMIPRRNPKESWDPSECTFRNRYICEADVVIWPI